MAWSEDLSVGVTVLDEHHKHLFHLLDEVAHVAEADGDFKAMTGVFSELAAYIAYHFAEEEAMMRRANFPFLDLHHHSHQTIAVRVADLAASLTKQNVHQIAGELRIFLTGWLIHHIEIEDFEYRPFLAKS